MKHKKLLAIILSVLVCMLSFGILAFADFGDFGGDADYGGDYGGDYDFDYDYDYDDDDYGDSGNVIYFGDSQVGGSNGGSGSPVIGFVILAGIVILIVVLKNRKNTGSKPIMPGATPTDASLLNPMETYLQQDEGFDQAAFTEKISNLYVQFQNAWQNKNPEELRPYISDAFFAQVDRQLDAYRKNRQTNRVERIAVLGVDCKGWRKQGENDVITVGLRTRIVDYVVDDKTGNIVRGSNTAEKFMEYEWELIRPTGTKTENGGGTVVHNCPNCGAVVNINKTAKCEYCDSIITVKAIDWVVDGIKGISQRTAQ